MCQSKILSLLNFTPKRPNPCAKYSDQLISEYFCCIFAEIQLCLFIVFGIQNGQVISWHWNTLQIRKCGGHLMYQRNGKKLVKYFLPTTNSLSLSLFLTHRLSCTLSLSPPPFSLPLSLTPSYLHSSSPCHSLKFSATFYKN